MEDGKVELSMRFREKVRNANINMGHRVSYELCVRKIRPFYFIWTTSFGLHLDNVEWNLHIRLHRLRMSRGRTLR